MRSGASWEKKQKHCDPTNSDDAAKGDQWDHTAIDVGSRLVVTLEVGKRDGGTVKEAVSDFAGRTGDIVPAVITTDDCSTYAEVLLGQYGETVVPPRTGKPGRPRKPYKQWPAGTTYATVNKTYRKGKVAVVRRTLVHGSEEDLARGLEASPSSDKINTAFVERQNGTDRCYNARKVRQTYQFSKDLLVHVAIGWWVMFCYNFHHLHRSLRILRPEGGYLHRTPAMAIGIEERPLTVADMVTTQAVGFVPPTRPTLAAFRARPCSGTAP